MGRPLAEEDRVGRIVFCGIGWMGRYRGLSGQPDKIVGGGRYVKENETGHEVCNFLRCADGNVYGHVETIRGEVDRQIHIEKWGGNGGSLTGVDIVWMATHPQDGGRRVVGWYRDAMIFRGRQTFQHPPSKQHRIDHIDTYRTIALSGNVHLLDIDERTLAMPRGPGWMGQTQWWSPPDDAGGQVHDFVEEVRHLLLTRAGTNKPGHGGSVDAGTKNSPDTASDPYTRYIKENEIQVSPRHNQLQGQFQAFLATIDAQAVQANLESVDLRYQDAKLGTVLVELKPCDMTNVRYAIRTAMGQLLDYRQRSKGEAALLIVAETKPNQEDRDLARSNGFGLAYPSRDTFKVIWP